MQALRIYAGPGARQHIEKNGLLAQHVGVVPAAAGGPKGLVLGPLDRFIFGEWLADTTHRVDLVGASIGAWRMATACLGDTVAALQRLEHDYIHQHYEAPPGRKRPSAQQVSDAFSAGLEAFYRGRIHEVLAHPRWRLHVLASRGLGLLHREHALATPLGYLGAFLSNAVHRGALGGWLERVVFSVPDGAEQGAASAANARPRPTELPFGVRDYPTRQVALTETNFRAAVQASCSIPFVLRAVHDIPGAPRGAYWDGGITDYHLHLDYQPGEGGVVLYPHFQKAVVPGWLDKALKWRHAATPFLDRMVVLAPNPEWVATLPNGKLPDRTDFTRYGNDLASRVKAWTQAASASQQLADEFAQWLRDPDPARVLPL